MMGSRSFTQVMCPPVYNSIHPVKGSHSHYLLLLQDEQFCHMVVHALIAGNIRLLFEVDILFLG